MAKTKFLLANRGQGVIDSNNPIVEDDLFLVDAPKKVTDLNTNPSKHNILQIGSTIIGETITELKPLELVGNIFTLKMQGENGVVQEVAIDLSSLKTTESGVTNATYNAATNIILLTEADGTQHSIDLSEFSIIRTVDVNGVVTLTQEGVVKATISKVGESGEYSHILNLPDLTIYETKVDATTHKTNTTNPHGVTASQVGLGSVNNTSDINKPVSTAQQTEINAAEQRAKDAIDSEIDVIRIKKSNLPANFTIGDVLNYLNTLTITKAKDEEIFWETGDFFDTLTIVYPTEGTVIYDSSTVTMQITIT